MAAVTPPLLSIGMIVKDEMRCLKRCMDSLQPLREAIPCELVIADTGSTDGSRELAASYADLLFDFPWIDDFSAARNAVMDRCTGVWYLSIDADEWLGEDFSGLIRFLKGPESKKYKGAALLIRNYVTSTDREQYTDFFGGRMIRMDTGGRYKNPVHESFADYAMPMVMLEQVMFHHDGYIKDDEALEAKKAGRNERLLVKKYADDPFDLITLLQMMDSKISNEDYFERAERAINLIHSGKAKKEQAAPAIYRQAIEAAGKVGKLDLMHQWIAEAEDHYPMSIYIRIDGEAAAASQSYHAKQYQEALAYGEKWEAGIAAFEQGNFAKAELTISALTYSLPFTKTGMYSMLFDCCCKLNQRDQAAVYFNKIDLEHLEEGNWRALVYALFNEGEKFAALPDMISRLWTFVCEQSKDKNPKWQAYRDFLWSTMNGAFIGIVKIKPNGIHEAIASLQDCEPGRSARIFFANSPEEMRNELYQVENWDDVLYMVYPRIMSSGISFPDSFYEQDSEKLASIAASITQYATNFVNIILSFSRSDDFSHSPTKLSWIFDVIAATLRSIGNWDNEPLAEDLCELFAELSRLYLTTIYQPSILQENTISALPGLHRFAWYYLKAREALEEHGGTEFIRILRKGLETAPAMKNLVNFLAETAVQQISRRIKEASPELVALAEQVRNILEAYPEDDPAIQELKHSEVYQKVAYLIEEPAVPWMM